MSWFKKSLRYVLVAFVLTYFMIASGMLVVRYVLLPQLNDWRPSLEAQLSQTLGAAVQIKDLEGQWRGLNPSAKVEGLSITLPGQPRVYIPKVSAVLSWKTLFLLRPTFLDLYVEGLTLNIVQEPNGDLLFQGLHLAQIATQTAVSSDASTTPQTEHIVDHHSNVDQFLQSPAWLWLKQQGQISIAHSTVIWQDQKRQAPDLVLNDLNINLQNTLLSHQLSIKVTPPAALSEPIALGIKKGRLLGQIGSALPGGSDGEIFISAANIDLQAWKPWVDVPALAGQFAMRAWLDLQANRIKYVTLDFAGLGASSIKKLGDDPALPDWSIGQFKMRTEGGGATLSAGIPVPDVVSKDFDSKKIIVKLKSTDLQLTFPAKEQTPTVIQSADLDLSITRESVDNFSIDIIQSRIQTPDGLVSLLGNWRTSNHSAQGVADLTGQINNLNLPALYRYIPPSVDAKTSVWLSHAFKSGVIDQATFVLKGALSDYPFSKAGDTGQFRLTGQYSGLNLDYVPDAPANSKWPMLKGARGTLNVDQDLLSILANGGQLTATHSEKEYEIGVQNLRIDVESIATKPSVSVVTQTFGVATNYLNIIKYSALSAFTPPELSKMSVNGLWELPFTVNLLLDKPENASFDANLLFKQNTIQYDNTTLVKQLTGQINITQNGIKTNSLTGILLGGPVSVKGDLSSENRTLVAQGDMSVAALSEVSGSSLMSLLKGQFAYEAKLEELASKQFKATFETSLKGVSINLPAPLGKTSNAQLPLSLQWVFDEKNKSSLGNVDLKIGTLIKAWGALNAANAPNSTPLLNQFSIGIGREPDKTAKGFSMAAQLSQLDAMRWQDALALIKKEIDRPVTGRPLMPDVSTIRLSTALVELNDQDYKNVSMALTQSSPSNWTIDLGAETFSGSIRLKTQAGQVQGPINVHFPKLEVGGQDDKTDDDLKPAAVLSDTKTQNDILDNVFWRQIEEINIRVDNFVLFGNHVGSLDLNAVPQLEDRRWKIDDLNINTPHGELKSQGFLRVDGNRGVDLGIKADVENLGKLLAYVGYPDRILNGSGVMEANIDWAEFPWSTDPAGLSGSAQVNLKSGVFEHVNSRSARLLEILSLQSLKRFFSLDINADNTFKSGFPWGSIEGDFVIESGNVNTKNLVIESPVAEIVLVGDTNMVRQDWNIQALVKPQLDFSGTAIASGFVLNPIVGLSALIGQYILKNPIEKAMQATYNVTGPWDDPKVDSKGVTETNVDRARVGTEAVNP